MLIPSSCGTEDDPGLVIDGQVDQSVFCNILVLYPMPTPRCDNLVSLTVKTELRPPVPIKAMLGVFRKGDPGA